MVPRFLLKEEQLGLASERLGYQEQSLTALCHRPGPGAVRAASWVQNERM